MARMARLVVPGQPHHVTQRGNRRQQTFFGDCDYLAYLTLLQAACARHGVVIWAYCLMPNHVHLVAAPEGVGSLSAALGETHQRYTRMINRRERWTGYLWQGRFASFALEGDYLAHCVRYVGLNPVRAGLTQCALDWPWSSVAAHCGRRVDPLIDAAPAAAIIGPDPARYFAADVSAEAGRKLRWASRTGKPLGAAAWVKALAQSSGRDLALRTPGRPPRSPPVPVRASQKARYRSTPK